MPLVNREEAIESGYAQVRSALQKFEGTVATAEFGEWGGSKSDEDTGKPIPPKEYLEVTCLDVVVLETTEELSMPIEEWNFRVNCSNYKGSFWVEKFLESADVFKLLIPDDLVGKRIVWGKASMDFNIKGRAITQSNYVIMGVKEAGAPAVPSTPALEVVEEPRAGTDTMENACVLAVGKTEAQFRSSIALDPKFTGSPLLSLAKAGAITQTLVNEGKLVLAKEGTKEVYQLV